jgi:hypothetical protein
MKTNGGSGSIAPKFLTSALDEASSQLRAPDASPRGKWPPLPIEKEAGWTPAQVWTLCSREKFYAPAENATPGRSSSLYRLSYRGCICIYNIHTTEALLNTNTSLAICTAHNVTLMRTGWRMKVATVLDPTQTFRKTVLAEVPLMCTSIADN